MDGFVLEIRSDVGRSRTDVRVEDMGLEESLHGVNPLPRRYWLWSLPTL